MWVTSSCFIPNPSSSSRRSAFSRLASRLHSSSPHNPDLGVHSPHLPFIRQHAFSAVSLPRFRGKARPCLDSVAYSSALHPSTRLTSTPSRRFEWPRILHRPARRAWHGSKEISYHINVCSKWSAVSLRMGWRTPASFAGQLCPSAWSGLSVPRWLVRFPFPFFAGLPFASLSIALRT